MKKLATWIVTLLALSLWVAGAMAVTDEQARELAAQAVGADAQIMGIELDDGMYEVRLSDTGATYEADVRATDGAIIKVKSAVFGGTRATAYDLIENQAADAVLTLHPGAEVDLVLAEREDGSCVYEVFYSAEGEMGSATLNAQTGDVVETKRWPEAAKQGVLTAANAASKALSRQTGELRELELDYGRRGYVYEGEILSGRTEISFELDAQTGDFIEWEIDD